MDRLRKGDRVKTTTGDYVVTKTTRDLPQRVWLARPAAPDKVVMFLDSSQFKVWKLERLEVE